MATNPDPNAGAERAPPPPLLPADSTSAQPDASTTYTPGEKEDLMTAISARRSDRTTSARLSLPTPQRLLLGTSTAFLVGLTLGGTHGFGTAGLRFRAENAHRLPKDPTGWYFYHKSKNYRMMLDGVREGVRMGGRVAVWTLVFLGTEEVWDNVRGRRDVGNTVIASATVAGGFSLWSKCLFFFFSVGVDVVLFYHCNFSGKGVHCVGARGSGSTSWRGKSESRSSRSPPKVRASVSLREGAMHPSSHLEGKDRWLNASFDLEGASEGAPDGKSRRGRF